MRLALSLAITAARAAVGGGSASEVLTDESANSLTDESANNLESSGA